MKIISSIKTIALSSILIFTYCYNAFGQVHTFSPYSRKGIGLIEDNNFGASMAMGSTGIGLRLPNSINQYNPASYSAQDSLSFIFDISVNLTHSEYKTNELTETAFDGNIDHFAASFPIIGKIWYSSIGLLPYSHVGYSIIGSQTVPGTDSRVDEIYKGSGGLNKLYFGNAVNLTPWLSVGLNISYIFGVIDYEYRSSFQQLIVDTENDTSYYILDPNKFNIHNDENRNISGFRFTYGIQLHKQFNKFHSFVLGLTFENKNKLYEDNHTTLSSLAPVASNTTNISYKDTVLNNSGSITMPFSLGIGFSYMYKLSLLAVIDFKATQWSQYRNLIDSDTLVNSQSLNLGLEFVNNPVSRNYLSRIHFRVGGHYNSGNIKTSGEQIKTYSLSGGVGLPFGISNTMFHIGYEYNIEGTTQNNLIQNNYGVITFGATLYDFWFFKRKFD